MLFTVLQANYFEKISLIVIFSLANPNAPGLHRHVFETLTAQVTSQKRVSQNRGPNSADTNAR